jgi:hypothetical protein
MLTGCSLTLKGAKGLCSQRTPVHGCDDGWQRRELLLTASLENLTFLAPSLLFLSICCRAFRAHSAEYCPPEKKKNIVHPDERIPQ